MWKDAGGEGGVKPAGGDFGKILRGCVRLKITIDRLSDLSTGV
jgi:hypothetical protein